MMVICFSTSKCVEFHAPGKPTASTAAAARKKGISIVEDFFGVELAHRMKSEGLSADLMAANNVLAHVPDINDFVAGFTKLLKPEGWLLLKFRICQDD